MKRAGVFVLIVLALLRCLPVAANTGGLTKRQLKALNRKLPAKVRNFLQTAEIFEIRTDTVSEEPEKKPEYVPNRKYVIRKAATRDRVLRAFYYDIATGGSGAACFYPNHSIVARKGKRTVTLTICYTCGEFVVSGAFGKWSRGLSTKDPIPSEALINRLLEKYGVPIKTR